MAAGDWDAFLGAARRLDTRDNRDEVADFEALSTPDQVEVLLRLVLAQRATISELEAEIASMKRRHLH